MKSNRLIKNGRPIIYAPEQARAFKSGKLAGYVYEHIYVAEKLLGRPLDEHEVVHHVDGNKKNNDPANLLVFSSSGEHSRFHSMNLSVDANILLDENGITCHIDYASISDRVCVCSDGVVRFVYTCDHCGKSFTTVDRRASTKKHHYCSYACSRLAARVVTRPDKNQIIADLSELKSYLAVGRKYGVTDNTVRKWLKHTA